MVLAARMILQRALGRSAVVLRHFRHAVSMAPRADAHHAFLLSDEKRQLRRSPGCMSEHHRKGCYCYKNNSNKRHQNSPPGGRCRIRFTAKGVSCYPVLCAQHRGCRLPASSSWRDVDVQTWRQRAASSSPSRSRTSQCKRLT